MELGPMLLQLLWVEIGLKAGVGLVLVLFPRTLARVLGLPVVTETFWPRLLGATLLGLAVATVIETHLPGRNGLGLAGHIALNLIGALAIVSLLILGRAGTLRRGRVLLWIVAAAMALLALVELAWA